MEYKLEIGKYDYSQVKGQLGEKEINSIMKMEENYPEWAKFSMDEYRQIFSSDYVESFMLKLDSVIESIVVVSDNFPEDVLKDDKTQDSRNPAVYISSLVVDDKIEPNIVKSFIHYLLIYLRAEKKKYIYYYEIDGLNPEYKSLKNFIHADKVSETELYGKPAVLYRADLKNIF